MKNKFSLAIVFSFCVVQLFAQTSLVSGDLMFVGIQSGQTGQTVKDRFAFIVFKDLEAGTQITFTDNAVIGQSPLQLCANEGTALWTATQVVAAGSVITLSEDTIASIGTVSGGLAFSQNGDQVLAYQTSATDTSFISGISTTNWLSTCSSGCGNTLGNNSATCLPLGLESQVNVVDFTPEKNNSFFNIALLNGSPQEIRTQILNPANWTRSDSLQVWPTWNVTVVTSVEKFIKKQKLSLYPTVSGGNFTLVNNSESAYEFTVHDVLGQIQFSGVVPVGKKEFSFFGLSKGFYFVSSKNKEGNSGIIRFQISK